MAASPSDKFAVQRILLEKSSNKIRYVIVFDEFWSMQSISNQTPALLLLLPRLPKLHNNLGDGTLLKRQICCAVDPFGERPKRNLVCASFWRISINAIDQKILPLPSFCPCSASQNNTTIFAMAPSSSDKFSAQWILSGKDQNQIWYVHHFWRILINAIDQKI